MTLPSHHPPDAWLVRHAAGTLTEAEDLILAAHCTLCPSCRRDVAAHESLVGAALIDLPPAAIAPGTLQSLLGRLGPQERTPAPPPQRRPNRPAILPTVLEEYTGPLEAITWTEMLPGVRVIELPLRFGEMPVRLFELAAGTALPHTHPGLERTLVLTGAYVDQDGRFARGDLGIQDETATHDQRILPGEPCLALVVADGPEVPLL